MRKFLALTLVSGLALSSVAQAQTAIRIDPAPESRWSRFTRNYQPRSVPPVNLGNTSRIDALLRAGNLYLSAQDVIALVLENNIDIEVQRYGPLLAREVLRRAEGGGLLRSVGATVQPGPTSVSLAGVSLTATGVNVGGGAGVSSGGGIVTQLGPAIPSFDPSLSGFMNFAHTTSPQSNTVLTGTTSLITSTRTYQAQYTQNWSTGLSATATYGSTHTSVNSSFFSLNPYTSGFLDLSVTQNLLNGYGKAVNERNIRVQKNNLKVTDLQFKQQVITTVAAALNLYYDLVSFNEDVKAKQSAVDTAEQLLKNNEAQVRIGTIAEIEVTRAQSQLFSARQDLLVAQTNILQQETILKNVISRSGVGTTELAAVHIIPTDTITIPDRDDPRTVEQLVTEGLGNRVEMQQARINLESNKTNLQGVRSSLRPSVQAFADLTNNGLTGDITAVGLAQTGVGYLAGGYGNLLGEIVRRNYPSYSAGVSVNIPLRNRQSQSDYVTSQLEIRQNELNLQKQANQIRVEVQNAVVGLQQARARHDAAVQARVLSQQTFEGDRRKYELGASTAYQVVQDQRDLAAAQSAEVQSLANYTHAKIALDQAIGATLDVNRVSLEEAQAGKVAAPPVTPPAGARQ
jgi:outer membrane protein TolC